ncbi:WSCD family member AGAP003962-like [Ylistrum balloti]|uniref:WSCD family member AGAP003962-like n=1 Tax=Ylistrum balloti TaxID=509963 RepID=UPI002905C891|nr:WSCD family member AGAP003962-like [Ylistrum balloti]
MCWKKRPKRSALTIIACAVVYVGAVNLLALYSMVKSYNSPVSWVQRFGHLYIGKPDTNNWTCKGLRYSTIPLPLTALVSFPGSGNTWLRHVIQQATGVATGSVYSDVGLKRDGFPGEGQTNASVIVIKTHSLGPDERARYVRAILLIRDPFDALLSEFNRRHGGHKGYAGRVHFQKNWYDYIFGTAGDWYDLYHDWLTFDGPLHVVMYKDLRENPSVELDRLMKFLGVSLSHKEKFCVMNNYEGNYRRGGKSASVSDRYTDYMVYMINNYKRKLSTELGHYLNKSNIRIS